MPPRPKKVLYIITKSNWGGAQKYVFDLATHLPQDFGVVVAFGGTGEEGAAAGLLEQKLHEQKIPTRFVRSFMRDISITKELAALRELYSLIKEERPDVVHLNSSKAGGVGALAARLAGVPHIIFTAHGWPFWEERGPFARALIWFFSWLTALLCHHIICISNYDLAVARRMPFVGGKAVRIYNGVDVATAYGDGAVIRNAFPPGVRITGTVGELTKNKNQIALVEQARQDPSMYVAIVGKGELREFLEQKITAYGLEKRVRLFGFLPAADVLRGFDTFALPSIKEGLPYVLLEARAAGLPIVANRIGGVGEILDATDMSEFSLKTMLQKTLELYAAS